MWPAQAAAEAKANSVHTRRDQPEYTCQQERAATSAAEPGRRQASKTTAAPRHLSHATPAGEATGNSWTAMAAPTYMEIPLRTNKT